MFFINLDVKSKDRFEITRFMDFKYGTFDPANSFFLRGIKNLSVRGVYVVIDSSNRPDVISYDIYENVNYWYFLMIFNDLIDFTNIPTGTKIKYFSLPSLEELFFSLTPGSRSV